MKIPGNGLWIVLASCLLFGCGFKTTPRPSAATIPGEIGAVEVHAFPDKVILRWESPISNTDGSFLKDVSGYKVYRSSRSVGEECENCPDEKKLRANVDFQKPVSATINGREVTYTDTDVSPGNVYSYSVSTYNLRGREGPHSVDATASLDEFPPPPDGLKAEVENGGIALTWASPPRPAGIRNYRIYRGESDNIEEMIPVGATKWAETTYKDRDIEKDKVYYYSVRSLKMSRGVPHESGASAAAKVVASAASTRPPENVGVAMGGDGVRVYWAPVKLPEGEARYNVYRSEANQSMVKVNTEPLVNPLFKDSQVVKGRRYRYAVTCFPANKPEEESSRTATEAAEFKP